MARTGVHTSPLLALGGFGPVPTGTVRRACQTCVAPNGCLQDSFYRTLTTEEQELATKNEYNFDVPSALDRQEILSCLQRLKEGRSVDVPIYDFATHRRSTETRRVSPATRVQHHV